MIFYDVRNSVRQPSMQLLVEEETETMMILMMELLIL